MRDKIAGGSSRSGVFKISFSDRGAACGMCVCGVAWHGMACCRAGRWAVEDRMLAKMAKSSFIYI